MYFYFREKQLASIQPRTGHQKCPNFSFQRRVGLTFQRRVGLTFEWFHLIISEMGGLDISEMGGLYLYIIIREILLLVLFFVPFRAKRGESTLIESVNANFSRRNFYLRPKKSLHRQLQDRTCLNFNSGKIRILRHFKIVQGCWAYFTMQHRIGEYSSIQGIWNTSNHWVHE